MQQENSVKQFEINIINEEINKLPPPYDSNYDSNWNQIYKIAKLIVYDSKEPNDSYKYFKDQSITLIAYTLVYLMLMNHIKSTHLTIEEVEKYILNKYNQIKTNDFSGKLYEDMIGCELDPKIYKEYCYFSELISSAGRTLSTMINLGNTNLKIYEETIKYLKRLD